MYYLGVDLGGTNIAVGLVNEQGIIVHKGSTPTLSDRGYEEIMKDLANLCIQLLQEKNIDVKDVVSIGIGSPGTCDFENGVVVYANNLHFTNVPVRQEVQKYIQLPVYIENDANCAALGESLYGACKGVNDSITITLGTGVGAGIIVGGQILRGAFFGGGELGHHVIEMNGELCTCGRQGCWEAYASATALIREAKIAVVRNPKSFILDEAGGDIADVTAKTVFDAADRGDDVAREVIAQYITYVVEGLGNVINIFQPEIIAIGGGVAAQGEKIIAPIREGVRKIAYGGKLETQIVAATLGNDAGIIGAAFLK